MKIYSQDFLRRLREWTLSRNIHLIADEIMTGFGRTGKMLACEHAEIEPDFICLSKGMTSGWLPLSAVLTRQSIYDLFYDDYSTGKSFLHSHTYCGNALAASVALETMRVMEEEVIVDRANAIGITMRNYLHDIAKTSGRLTNVRGMGAMVAADLVNIREGRRVSIEITRKAAELGLLLRPLGHTIYWLSPLIANENDLRKMAEITEKTLAIFFSND